MCKRIWLIVSAFYLSLCSLNLTFKGEEKYIANIKQLTFAGDNAEAYFSWDDKHLIFQSTRPPYKCDQIFIMDIDGKNKKLVSTGFGRTTCSYFMPGDEKIIYSSTHHISKECPEVPKLNLRRYYWPIFNYDIYLATRDGKIIKRLTDNPEYDAEGVVSRDGRIVFTSFRDGDIGIYIIDTTGNVKKVINKLGYEGGPWFSPDGAKIVFRAFYPQNEDEKKEYLALLEKGVVSPSWMEIFTVDIDGKNLKQITNFKKVCFAPYWHPSGKYIIFSANLESPRNFDLYIIKSDGTGLERVTYFEGFESFPMFSHDGKKLVFCSNRGGENPRQTNVFICDWLK
jgi:Tol biopolymer transport system component